MDERMQSVPCTGSRFWAGFRLQVYQAKREARRTENPNTRGEQKNPVNRFPFEKIGRPLYPLK